ncbi:hypothetical protein M422DRAFT_238623 [Sphaerobolus stellatus SS14]|nr:hypothetical protein M422DRAFT_238623 [Sphaerobolus stellatus SS14]
MAPIHLDYGIGVVGKALQLTVIVGDKWIDSLGIEGLPFSNVKFTTPLRLLLPAEQKASMVETSAYFNYKSTYATFSGSYARGGAFSISASFQSVILDSIRDIYESIYGAILRLPSLDVTIDSATITLSFDNGLEMLINNVDEDVKFEIDGTVAVEVREAILNIKLVSTSEGDKADVTISGQTSVVGLDLKVLAHLYPPSNDSKGSRSSKGIEWTILSQLATKDEIIFLSKIVPGVKDSFLDLPLSK